MAGGGAAAAPEIDAYNLSMTKTVEGHIDEISKNGTLARPYGDSRATMQLIIEGTKPTADPQGNPNTLRWDAPGTMNGSRGSYQLVIDTSTNTVLHWQFESSK
jgi:hypothetical protein